ncbi:MAG: UvrD-helicase domain-containing protein [Anaerolineales bacterium]|nr:UvrD-helicase domain-containing protein [Anaerolineales bacterium]
MPWNENLEGASYEIAACDDPILRVVAGPGTGKTYALMRRVARLLENGIDPRRVLLVTFTRMAAKDLQREIEALDVGNANQIKKGTLHSFCFSILNDANVLELTGRTPRMLLDFEKRFLLEDLGLGDFGNFHDRRRMLLAFEAAWATEQYQIPGWPNSEIEQEFQNHLLSWLRFHDAMLVGELIPLTLDFLQNNPANPYLSSFDHVLIDEYQDLNRAEQSLLVLTLHFKN